MLTTPLALNLHNEKANSGPVSSLVTPYTVASTTPISHLIYLPEQTVLSTKNNEPAYFMLEKHFILEEADPVIFYGVNNANIRMLRALCPKLRIMARDNVVRVVGDEEEMAAFEDLMRTIEKHCAKFNSLTEEDILLP